jgi:hypothetical protein
MIKAPDGGYLIFGGTSSYGNVPVIGADQSGFIVKTDPSGMPAWSFVLGDTISVVYHTATVRDDGGYYLVGRTQLTSADAARIVLTNISANGTVLWTKVLRSVNEIQQLKIGKVLAVGSDEYLIIGELVLSGAGTGWNSDQFAIKVDGDGAVIWTSRFGTDTWMQWSAGRDVVALADGGYLIAGVQDFAGNIQLVKLDQNGTFLWDRTYNDEALISEVELKATADGIFLLGSGGGGTILMKMDNSTEVLWQKRYMHDILMRAAALDVRNNGEMIIVSTISVQGMPAMAIIVHADDQGAPISSMPYAPANEPISVVDIIAEDDGSITFAYDRSNSPWSWWGPVQADFNLVRMVPDLIGFSNTCVYDTTVNIQMQEIPELEYASVMSQQPPFVVQVLDKNWEAIPAGEVYVQCITVNTPEELQETGVLKLYPNPARSGFWIGDSEQVNVLIMDMLGRRVLNTTSDVDGYIAIPPGLPSGSYHCQFTSKSAYLGTRTLMVE